MTKFRKRVSEEDKRRTYCCMGQYNNRTDIGGNREETVRDSELWNANRVSSLIRREEGNPRPDPTIQSPNSRKNHHQLGSRDCKQLENFSYTSPPVSSPVWFGTSLCPPSLTSLFVSVYFVVSTTLILISPVFLSGLERSLLYLYPVITSNLCLRL